MLRTLIFTSTVVLATASQVLAGGISSTTTNSNFNTGVRETAKFDRVETTQVNRSESGHFASSAQGAKFESSFTGNGNGRNGTDVKFNFNPDDLSAAAWVPGGEVVIQADVSEASKRGSFSEDASFNSTEKAWGTRSSYDYETGHRVKAESSY